MIENLRPIDYEGMMSMLPPLEEMSVEELRRVAEVKTEYVRQRELFPILYYVPQEYQEKFHRSTKKIKAAFGGNQSGKTTALIVDRLQISLGIHPTIKVPIPNRGRIGTTDLQKGIGEDIEAVHLKRWIPESEVLYRKRYSSGQISKIGFKNRSTVDFLSYEQEDKIWEGWQGDWVGLNEPPPREKFIASMRGLVKRSGSLAIAATPLDEPWLYDEIYLKGGTKDIDVFNFDIEQNKFLSKEAIELFTSTLTDDEKEARLHGKFRHLSGLIYKEFNPAVYCDYDDYDIPKEWTRFTAMDYHPSVNVPMLWVACSPNGHIWVYDELETGGTIEEIAEKIKAKENGVKIHMRWIDPLSATPERSGNKITCAQREFLRYGIGMRSAIKSFSVGINAVHSALKLDREGKPVIHFLRNRVPEMIRCMGRYQWSDYLTTQETGDGKPNKKNSHFPDCLRYILVGRPSYVDMNTKQMIESNYKAHAVTGYGH